MSKYLINKIRNILLKREEQGLYSEMSILYRKDKDRLWKCSTLKEARDMTTQH